MRTDARQSTRSLPAWLLLTALILLAFRLGNMGWRRFHPLPPGAQHDLVQWVGHDKALAAAKATGKPLFYDFTAAWCGPCKMLAKEVFNDKEAAAFINEHFIPVSVLDRSREDGRNVEWVAKLQEKYSIEAFPTLVVETGKGSKTLSGYSGKRGTLGFLGENLPPKAKR